MAYFMAGGRGDLAMIRWLVREAKAPAVDVDMPYWIEQWPTHTPSDSLELLQAVQLLVGEAGCRAWDGDDALLAAIRKGNLALVQYLWQQQPGYVPDWKSMDYAAQGGSEALVEWLAEQRAASDARA